MMYPDFTVAQTKKSTTLNAFLRELGKYYAYAYDMKVIGVLVNGKRLWPSAKLESGDKVIIFPLIMGG